MAAIGSGHSRAAHPNRLLAEEELKSAEEALNDQIQRINKVISNLGSQAFSEVLHGPNGQFITSKVLEHTIEWMGFPEESWQKGVAVLKSSHAQRLKLAGPIENVLRGKVCRREWDRCVEILEIPVAYESLSPEAAWRLLNINFIREKNSRLMELWELRDYTEAYKKCYELLSHRHFSCIIL